MEEESMLRSALTETVKVFSRKSDFMNWPDLKSSTSFLRGCGVRVKESEFGKLFDYRVGVKVWVGISKEFWIGAKAGIPKKGGVGAESALPGTREWESELKFLFGSSDWLLSLKLVIKLVISCSFWWSTMTWSETIQVAVVDFKSA